MNIALILSGGMGSRLGADIPKQYVEVDGRPILSYSLECLSCHKDIDVIWIVAEPAWQERILDWLPRYDSGGKFRGFSLPGANRQLSIYHGLEDIRDFAGGLDAVLIHDAARPLLSAGLVTDCLGAIQGHDGVLPVLPMKDTVYESEDGERITSLLDRKRIFAGQAPEVFRFGKYFDANKRLMPEAILTVNGSTEPAVMAGMDIVMIPGEECNYKITTRADLERFREDIEKGKTGEYICETIWKRRFKGV